MINFVFYNKNSRINRIISHVSFWIIYVLFHAIIYGSFEENNYFEELQKLLILLPARLAATYFLLYFLMPKFLFKKAYIDFILWIILSMLFFGFLQRTVNQFIIYPLFREDLINTDFFVIPKMFLSIINIIYVASVAASIKLFKKWYMDQQARQMLKEEKLEAELKFLKSQIHPHFLFNTLNNLYVLTLKNSDKAPEVVIKLSELLDYMLYDCNNRKVLLSKEIKLVKNYIELEELRYGDRLKIDFSVEGETNYLKVSPLLLLPLVENAFKHGASEDTENPWIKISILAKDRQLNITVSNSMVEKKSTETIDKKTEGIGLKNLKRRLELLYSNNYELKIKEVNKEFSASLRINSL